MPGLLVVGVGSGIAASVARRFAVAGYPVGLISSSRASVHPVATAVAALGARVVTETADAAQEFELIAAIDRILAQLGVPDVVVYNAGLIRADKPATCSTRPRTPSMCSVLSPRLPISRRSWQRTPAGRCASPAVCLSLFRGW